MKLKTSKKGFTLVELVIVIAVLAIIAAIAIPSVTGVIKNANKATDDSNCQALTATIKTFMAENEARETHTPEGDKATLNAESTVATLLQAYGIATVPGVKSSKDIFVWEKATKTVKIGTAVSGTHYALTDKDSKLGVMGIF